MKKQYRIFDAHCDTLSAMADFNESFSCNRLNTDKSRMMEYGGYTQVFACFIAPQHSVNAMDRFDMLSDLFYKTDFSGIDSVLSVEGADMIKSLLDLDHLHNRCVKAIALTWNNSNYIGGGADDPDVGLSELGKSVVRSMNDKNILVDVSHLNDKTFYDVASVTRKPIIASHSDCRAVCGHKRNITDDMFHVICQSGGCVGINLYPPFLTDERMCTSDDAVSHIIHFLELGGEDHIGIGADFDGTENLLPFDIKGCQDLYIIFDKLRNRGVTDDIIEKISHLNFERVFNE